MPKITLSAVSRTQGNNRALKEGRISLPDFELVFEEVDPLVRAFRNMVRDGTYDVSEMALTTYICARAHGAKLTGLPIFLVRDFHHKSMCLSAKAGLKGPKDLDGRRVGVNRGYTVTTGVWARSILAEEHGVDLSRVTWARSGDEHVAGYLRPTNVEELGGEGSLEEQLQHGTLAAAVGLPAKGQGLLPMIPDAFDAGLRAFRERGFYPINHLVVIRDDVLAANPGLARQVFDAFAASKKLYLDDLRAGRITEPTPIDKVHQAVMEHQQDPLPYGLAPNAAVLETLMAQATAQGIIDNPIGLEDLFAPELLDVVA